MKRQSNGAGTRERIYAVVATIPSGFVATYGQVAKLAGLPGHARQIGYALAALTDDRELAWQRVINAKGEISARANPYHETIQRALLEQEGIEFDAKGRVSLNRFQFNAANSATKARAPADRIGNPRRSTRTSKKTPKRKRAKR